MGDINVDSVVVGVCTISVGDSGDPYVDTDDVGSFGPLTYGGSVLVGSSTVGYYAITPVIPDDPRHRTKIYLETYITPENLTKDDNSTLANWAVIYAHPNYKLALEFLADSNPVDLLFTVGTPNSEALPVGVGYIEHVPITIWTVDKTGITGTKLRWTAEKELRRVTEENPTGSLRTLDRMSDNEKKLGSTTLYSVTYILRYKRYA